VGGGGIDDDAVITAFTALGRLDAADIVGITGELSAYMMNCEQLVGVEAEDELKEAEAYWQRHHLVFPYIAKVVRVAYTYTTSSAAAERVFSVLKNSFGREQKEALEDYVSLSVMLQTNKRE
jgi:hypothetical protein